MHVSPSAAGSSTVKSASCIINILIAVVLFGGTVPTDNADNATKPAKVLAWIKDNVDLEKDKAVF